METDGLFLSRSAGFPSAEAEGTRLVLVSPRDSGRDLIFVPHRLLYLSAVALQGVALTGFAISEVFWITAPIMLVVGIGEAGRMSLGNVLVQSYVADEYRGRAMSVFMMQRSLASLGTFFVGVLASAIGVQWVLGGLAVALFALASAGLFVAPGLRKLD